MVIIDSRIEKSQFVPEFEALLDIYVGSDPRYILEIGSLMGWSLRHWIAYAHTGLTAISLDLPVKDFCGPQDPRCAQQDIAIKTEWPAWAKKNKSKLYLIQGESQNPLSKNQVLNILQGNLLDFIFIDGNHFYDYVKQDFLLYAPLVRPGGIVAFHDIGKNEEGTVDIFWNEVKQQYKHKEIMLHPNQEKGIGILYF